MPTDEARFNTALGARIRAAREKIVPELSQQKLADRVQVGRTSIVLIERGAQKVPAYLLVRLAQELRVDVPYLLGVSERQITPENPSTTPFTASPTVNQWLNDFDLSNDRRFRFKKES